MRSQVRQGSVVAEEGPRLEELQLGLLQVLLLVQRLLAGGEELLALAPLRGQALPFARFLRLDLGPLVLGQVRLGVVRKTQQEEDRHRHAEDSYQGCRRRPAPGPLESSLAEADRPGPDW